MASIRDQLQCLKRKEFMSSLECKFGLLDQLLENKGLSHDTVADLRQHKVEKWKHKLIDHINEANINYFVEGLRKSNQTHLANFIIQNGVCTETVDQHSEDVDEWPLSDDDRDPIRSCYVRLVEEMYTESLVDLLFQNKCLSAEHKSKIESYGTAQERNRQLLDIMLRRSVGQFKIFYQCLEQDHKHLGLPIYLRQAQQQLFSYDTTDHPAAHNRSGRVFNEDTAYSDMPYERILLTVGLDSSSMRQKTCEISLEKRDTINVINSTPAKIWAESAACVVSNVLYAVGLGGEARNQLWAWSASRDEWKRCADMRSGTCRRRHCVTSVGDKIYVLGGWVDADKRTLDSILCYDINTNKWSEAGKLCHAVWAAACVPCKHYVYVFGGRDKDNEEVNLVQVYDTTTRNVSLASNPMPAAYRHMRAVLWISKALLIGRITCYLYDFESNTWQERERFKTDVDHFGLTLNDNTLYISGGGMFCADVWTCKTDVKRLSVDDFCSDNKEAEWKNHATLPIPACIHAYSPVSMIKYKI